MSHATSPSAPKDESDEAVVSVRRALLHLGQEQEPKEELAGGASTRRFFRVEHEGRPTIAMYVPAPSQEIAKARQVAGTGPFVEVQKLLEEAAIPVPKIYGESVRDHILLVEDLGDDTLAAYLAREESARESLYQTAVRELARAQQKLDPLPAGSIIRTRAFDEELLRWEVEHFRTWALEARGIVLSPAQADVFERSASYLAKTIASWPRGFVHRDYQSRNLMVRPSGDGLSLTWIDFQDAMMGPRAYDLVALLTDSYQPFDREFIRARLLDYCAARGASDLEALEFEFDFLAVQRKLKDAGRFIFIDRVNKNPNFLPYVDSTIARARACLGRVSSHGPLGELAELLDEVCG